MRRASIIALTLLLAACGSAEDSKVTETRMDDIDSLEGTISDEMVNTDELNEQPMVEAEAAPTLKAKAEKSEDKAAPEPKVAPEPVEKSGDE
jgi:uncharacterized lipoprotein